MATPRIKLLQIVNSLHAGGMENIVVEVCNGLDPAKYDITVCCLETQGAFAQRLRYGVNCLELNKAQPFRWADVKKMRAVMQNGSFDVVHTHHLGGLMHAVMARSFQRKPHLVHSEHIMLHDWELDPRRLWQRRLFYLAAKCVFTLSGQQQRQLKTLRLSHKNQLNLPNGVDCERFKPVSSLTAKQSLRSSLGLELDAIWMGKVARFATAKRHELLVEAFELAATTQPKLRLLLVGDGGVEKDKVIARISQSPAREKIKWVGLQQNPVPWYQAMDVLIISSDVEGMPNAALEGMACGLPLLANASCGADEVAEDLNHGWVRNFSNLSQLEQGLQEVSQTTSDRRTDMGVNARNHVVRQFSMQRMLEKYDRLYSATAENRKVHFGALDTNSSMICQQ